MKCSFDVLIDHVVQKIFQGFIRSSHGGEHLQNQKNFTKPDQLNRLKQLMFIQLFDQKSTSNNKLIETVYV